MLPRAAWHRFAPAPCAWLRAVVGTPWIYRCPEEASRLRSEALPKGSTAYGGGSGLSVSNVRATPPVPRSSRARQPPGPSGAVPPPSLPAGFSLPLAAALVVSAD